MSLRKEQVLAILALAVGLYYVSSLQKASATNPSSGRPRSYEPPALPLSPLVDPNDDPQLLTRDIFVEPAETRSLPPRDLPLPPPRVFGVVGLPLVEDAAWAHLLEFGGAPEQGVELTDPALGSAAGSAAAGDSEPQDPVQPNGTEQLARTYDLLETNVGPQWCLLEGHDGRDKFDLALLAPAELAQVRGVQLRPYLRTREFLQSSRTLEENVEIRKITLAQTLRNEVELEKRRVSGSYSVAGLERLFAFGEFLLDKARLESWVYDEAFQLADRILEISDGSPAAWRFKQRLLRLRGDLAAELEMYETMPDAVGAGAFRLQGRGELKAVLGLWEDAEADLRRAVEAAPRDPAPLSSLARLLLARGRVQEAATIAQKAWDYRATNADRDVQLDAAEVHLAALRHRGAMAEASTIASDFPDGDPARVALLQGMVSYARGDLTAATSRFEQAAASGTRAISSRGALGAAATAVRAGRYQDALDRFYALADDDPLLRHRAMAGMGLVYARVGDVERALAAIEAGLATAPGDWYLLYLQGYVLHLRGDHEAALDSLSQCLEQRDDMLHALLEVVQCHEALAAASSGQAAENLFRAMRYSARLAELAQRRGDDFRFAEVQGRVHFQGKELRTADEAFAKAQQAAQDPSDQLYSQSGRGLVLYARGRVDDARDVFLALQDSLGRGEPYWQYADGILAAIADHSQKVELVDRFERDALGSIWEARGFRVVDGAVRLRERLGATPVVATRVDAAEAAGLFLGAEVTLDVDESASGAVVGLRLLREQGNRKALEIWYGLKNDEPYLFIRDNKDDPEPIVGLAEKIAGFDPTVSQRLGLYLEPADENGRTLSIVAVWNGQQIHSEPLRGITSNLPTPLAVGFGGKGLGGGQVTATFDDFRVVKRQIQ